MTSTTLHNRGLKCIYTTVAVSLCKVKRYLPRNALKHSLKRTFIDKYGQQNDR